MGLPRKSTWRVHQLPALQGLNAFHASRKGFLFINRTRVPQPETISEVETKASATRSRSWTPSVSMRSPALLLPRRPAADLPNSWPDAPLVPSLARSDSAGPRPSSTRSTKSIVTRHPRRRPNARRCLKGRYAAAAAARSVAAGSAWSMRAGSGQSVATTPAWSARVASARRLRRTMMPVVWTARGAATTASASRRRRARAPGRPSVSVGPPPVVAAGNARAKCAQRAELAPSAESRRTAPPGIASATTVSR